MTEIQVKQVSEETKEEIKNLLEEFVSAKSKISNGYEFDRFVDLKKREYGLLPKYETLREFISKRSNGAYNHFYFNIMFCSYNVISVGDFINYGNEKHLDQYVVVDYSENGREGTNYHLQLEMKL